MFAGKSLQTAQKASRADLIKKALQDVLKIDARARPLNAK